MTKCLECRNKTKNPKFCSRTCSVSYNNRKNPKRKKIHKICKACGENINNDRTYCSVSCMHYYKYTKYIEDWLSGKNDGTKGIKYKNLSRQIRRYLIEQAKYKCTLCSWGETNLHTGKIPLEIDHIDGNYLNNSPDNLRVLCPNCHSLTPTHKGANAGNPKAQKRLGGNRGDYWKNK